MNLVASAAKKTFGAIRQSCVPKAGRKRPQTLLQLSNGQDEGLTGIVYCSNKPEKSKSWSYKHESLIFLHITSAKTAQFLRRIWSFSFASVLSRPNSGFGACWFWLLGNGKPKGEHNNEQTRCCRRSNLNRYRNRHRHWHPSSGEPLANQVTK